jgi:hypothetical protein
MQTLNLSSVKYLTVCRLCQQKFSAVPMDATPIIGQPQEALIKFVRGLADHLMRKHPENFGGITQGGQIFQGFLTLALFDSQDPNIVRSREMARAEIHALTRRLSITDESLVKKLDAIWYRAYGLPPQYTDVLQLLREIRSVLLEEIEIGTGESQTTETPT